MDRLFALGCGMGGHHDMKLSCRNQLRGKVTAIESDDIMAEVTIDIGGGQSVTSTITRSAVEELALKEGDQVLAVVKASSVMVMK